jgi:uncharacterized protein YgiM (DUF1202 family)
LFFVVGIALAALAFVGSRRSQAQTGPAPLAAGAAAEARVSASSLNLRTGPHVSYTAVAYLMEGEEVQLVGRNRTGSWVQIALYNGYRGWVNASYIRPTIDIAALPIADVALLGITAFVTNDPVPVYAGPDRGYALVGRGQPGEVLALNGRNDAATWVHVYLPDGRAGWAAADSSWLPSASLNDLPILTPFLDAPPPDLAPFFLVYTGPGFLYEPVDSVDEGQTLGILGRTADSRWVLVRLPSGREGWIAAEIIHVGDALANVPVVTGIAPPQVVGWQASSRQSAGQAGGGAATTATATAIEESAGGGKQPAVPPAATATDAPVTATPTTVPPTATATEPAPTATTTATSVATATGRATTTPPPSPTAAPTTVPSATPRATATIAPTDTPGTGGEATPPGLPIVYVYAAPDDSAEPILRVVPGQSVVLIGRTEDATWIKIWLPGGQEGWVRTEALQLEIDVTVLPVVEP